MEVAFPPPRQHPQCCPLPVLAPRQHQAGVIFCRALRCAGSRMIWRGAADILLEDQNCA